MQQVFKIEGMHCGGCVNRVTKALAALDPDVMVTLEPPQAVFDAPVTPAAVTGALAKAGDYKAMPT